MSLSFCLCADDYAMTPGVSRGILEALDADALTATSVMTTSPWWPDHAAALRRHVGRADIGLHLNLTLGAPLGPMPFLAPGGRLPDIRNLMRLDRKQQLPVAEVAEEIDRQCDRFAAVFGRAPDHVDGHQHVQVLRSIRPLLLNAIHRRGWTPWLRDSADRFWRLPWRSGRKKALPLCVLSEGFARECRQRDLSTNEGFSGFSSFDISDNYASNFNSYLNFCGSRHLVMCHPGFVDDALRALDPVVESREEELRFLIKELHPLLDARNARIKRLSEL